MRLRSLPLRPDSGGIRRVIDARIHRLQPGEGDRWRRLRLRALADAPHAFGTTHDDAARWPAERWEAQITELATFVAVVDGSDVGVARGAPTAREDVRELISMWVAPTARRHGMAVQLIESVAGWATEVGARVLALDVRDGNLAAIALYERAGFLRVTDDSLGEPALGETRFMLCLRPRPSPCG